MTKKILFLILSTLYLSSPACADAAGYNCKILEINKLGADGKFSQENGIYAQLIGKSFTVDRETGKTVGSPFSNDSYREVKVLDKGSSESSYKHIVISHEPNIWVQYLYVQEFEKGLDKPFWGTDDGNKIFSGICNAA